jgi:putative membrane protein
MRKTAISLALLVAVAACRSDRTNPDNAATDTTAMAATTTVPLDTAAASPAALTDPQVVGVVMAADDVEIQAAQQAQSMATDARVKSFAQRMITDHTAANKQVQELAASLNLTPASSGTSDALMQQGQHDATQLSGLSGAAYDKAYIDSQVTAHQQVINTADTQLVPAAQNPDLKTLLQSMRPTLQEHLDSAQAIQSSLPAS